MELDIRWLAGFWDGEGTFSLSTAGGSVEKGYFQPFMVMANTNEEIVRLVAEVLGGKVGNGTENTRLPNARPAWRMSVSSKPKVLRACELLEPHLVLKRRQCAIVKHFASLPDMRGRRGPLPDLDERLALYYELRDLNWRGLPA